MTKRKSEVTLATNLLSHKVILKFNTTLISEISPKLFEVSLDELTFLNILKCDSPKKERKLRPILESEANTFIGSHIFINRGTFLNETLEYSLPLSKYRETTREDILSLLKKMQSQ